MLSPEASSSNSILSSTFRLTTATTTSSNTNNSTRADIQRQATGTEESFGKLSFKRILWNVIFDGDNVVRDFYKEEESDVGHVTSHASHTKHFSRWRHVKIVCSLAESKVCDLHFKTKNCKLQKRNKAKLKFALSLSLVLVETFLCYTERQLCSSSNREQYYKRRTICSIVVKCQARQNNFAGLVPIPDLSPVLFSSRQKQSLNVSSQKCKTIQALNRINRITRQTWKWCK